MDCLDTDKHKSRAHLPCLVLVPCLVVVLLSTFAHASFVESGLVADACLVVPCLLVRILALAHVPCCSPLSRCYLGMSPRGFGPLVPDGMPLRSFPHGVRPVGHSCAGRRMCRIPSNQMSHTHCIHTLGTHPAASATTRLRDRLALCRGCQASLCGPRQAFAMFQS